MKPHEDGAECARTHPTPVTQPTATFREAESHVHDTPASAGMHAVVSRSGTANALARLARITPAVVLIAILAAFGHWLTPRFGMLPTVDQTMAVLACVALGICALALVIGGRR